MNRHARPIIFGEVLFDCFPDGTEVLGGAPFNVAWHCQAFGLNPLFVSRVGDDEAGQKILSAMQTWGMDIQGVQIDTVNKTGTVKVTFSDGEPDYDIVTDSAWDFIDASAIPEIEDYSLLYHGSLALRNRVSAQSLAQLKKTSVNNIFVDINLRAPWWNLQQIKNILDKTCWLKLNQYELSLLVPEEKDVASQARFLLKNYNPDIVFITLGEAGAIAVTETEQFSIIPERATNVIDTVGAGDAFASVLLLGLHKAWSLSTILSRAQEFASAVVAQRGATTEDKRFYQPFINQWSL